MTVHSDFRTLHCDPGEVLGVGGAKAEVWYQEGQSVVPAGWSNPSHSQYQPPMAKGALQDRGGGAGEQKMWNLLAAPLSGPITVPPNFYLWGYLKERVYSTKPRTITELKEGITEEI